ncbi:MAG: radical SAM protein [Ruminococcaceae bacterium]|nr:radical SAM protein [Oscillospiraceae bacterium]
MKCNLCPRNCNAERNDLENLNGYCKMPLLPRVARAALHFWEEPCISGENGSGTIFFSGCSLGCVYCQNYDLSHNGYGKNITIERLAEIFYELEKQGANNINLVNPTHYVFAIKKALDIYRPKIPIVYNSSGYDKVQTIKSLGKYIDIYLFDLKYLSNETAFKYSGAGDYPEVAKKAIIEGYKQKENCVFKDGILQSGLIVRHLILPQATKTAISVFDWYMENTPNAIFSVMSQYTPCGDALLLPPINRNITEREYDKVISYISNKKTDGIYIQDLESSSKKYIPEFNLFGV